MKIALLKDAIAAYQCALKQQEKSKDTLALAKLQAGQKDLTVTIGDLHFRLSDVSRESSWMPRTRDGHHELHAAAIRLCEFYLLQDTKRVEDTRWAVTLAERNFK